MKPGCQIFPCSWYSSTGVPTANSCSCDVAFAEKGPGLARVSGAVRFFDGVSRSAHGLETFCGCGGLRVGPAIILVRKIDVAV